MKRALCITLAFLLCLCGLCGCGREEVVATNTSTNCANIITGWGKFAYQDDYIYFSDTYNIREYDIRTGKTVELASSYAQEPDYMCVEGDRLYYVALGLHYITRDGKESGTVFTDTDRDRSARYLYMEGNTVYYSRYQIDEEKQRWNEYLYKRDLKTGEETMLVEGLLGYNYYVDSEGIYAIADNEMSRYTENQNGKLYYSPKGRIQFKEIQLPIKPIQVFPVGDALYIGNNAMLHRYENGKLTEMNLPAWRFQICGKYLITKDFYSKSQTASTSCKELSVYDLETGEKTVINDSVLLHAVLGDRYVCYWRADYTHQQWYYYDLQTGQTTLMYEIMDSEKQYSYTIG